MRVNSRLRRCSRIMFGLCLLLAVLVPVLSVAPWLYPAYFRDYWGVFAAVPLRVETLSSWQRGLGIAVSLIPAGLTSFALWRLAAIFREFANDRAFSQWAVRAFQTFATIIFLLSLAAPLVEAVQGVIVTWNNGPGQRELALTFRTEELRDILFAFLLLALALIFRHGYQLADEQAHML